MQRLKIDLRWGVIVVVLVGAALRFGHLDLKPLWLDEILTALLSLGRTGSDVPLDRWVSIAQLHDLFSLNPDVTCADIRHIVTTESTHPPFFFCLIHQWLQWVQPTFDRLTWQLRSIPALFGIGSIAAVYWLDRVAFSAKAGLVAAALLAVSPFAVYLSQEARHYTLPLLLVIVALVGLVQFVRNLVRGKRVSTWTRLLWVAANTIGLYAHYFFVVAYGAQLATLASVAIVRREGRKSLKTWLGELGFWLTPALLFLPWLTTLLHHFDRPETDWFKPFEPSWTDHFAPIVQTLASWVLMAIALPVEGQPLWFAIPMGLAMVGFTLWLTRVAWRGICDRWQAIDRRLELLTLASFTGWSLLAFASIVYGFGKDITTAPRYHFIYYPGICALLGAALTSEKQPLRRSSVVVAVGLLSSLFVTSDLAFHKPYYPRQLARSLEVDRNVPIATVVGYQNLQEIALGLSVALELPTSSKFALLDRTQSYEFVWNTLETLSDTLDLWVIAPGLRQAEYPQTLVLSGSNCDRDPNEYHRLGVPYQRYQCSRSIASSLQ